MLSKHLSIPSNTLGCTEASCFLWPSRSRGSTSCFQITLLPGAERNRKWPGRQISGLMVLTGRTLKEQRTEPNIHSSTNNEVLTSNGTSTMNVCGLSHIPNRCLNKQHHREGEVLLLQMNRNCVMYFPVIPINAFTKFVIS